MRLYVNRCDVELFPGKGVAGSRRHPEGSRQGRMITRKSREIKARLHSRGTYSFVLDHIAQGVKIGLRWQQRSQFPTIVRSRVVGVSWGVESSSVVERCVDVRRRVSTLGGQHLIVETIPGLSQERCCATTQNSPWHGCPRYPSYLRPQLGCALGKGGPNVRQ